MGKGAASPGLWQLWQFFCRIGATSLVNVGAFIFPICAKRHAAKQSANRKVRTVRFMTSMPLWLLLPFQSLEPAQRSYQECPTHRLECQETARDPEPSPASKLVSYANARCLCGAGAGLAIYPVERKTPSFRAGEISDLAGSLLLVNVVFEDADWCSPTRSCEVGRRPQSALPIPLHQIGPLLSEHSAGHAFQRVDE